MGTRDGLGRIPSRYLGRFAPGDTPDSDSASDVFGAHFGRPMVDFAVSSSLALTTSCRRAGLQVTTPTDSLWKNTGDCINAPYHQDLCAKPYQMVGLLYKKRYERRSRSYTFGVL